MTEPHSRPHLVVVQLDVGYTVSMGATILACETLERVLASVHALLLPHAFDADPLIAPSPPPPPAPRPQPPEPIPPDDDPSLPPYDPRVDTMPTDLQDTDDDAGPFAFRGEANLLLADERQNLAIAITAYREGTIDLEELQAGRARYYPSATDADLEAALLSAQGLDPTRFGNGVR